MTLFYFDLPKLILDGYVALGAALAPIAYSKDKLTTPGSILVKGRPEAEYSTLAKISIQDAIVAVTKATSGKVIEAALDRKSSTRPVRPERAP